MLSSVLTTGALVERASQLRPGHLHAPFRSGLPSPTFFTVVVKDADTLHSGDSVSAGFRSLTDMVAKMEGDSLTPAHPAGDVFLLGGGVGWGLCGDVVVHWYVVI